jgi:hypothetical protein
LKIFSLQGQDTEGNIPELANVLVKDPVAWVNVFNQLKQAMCNKTEPNLLREELYLQHFWRYGLEDIVNSREFRQFLPDCVIADLQKIRREKSTLDAQIGIQRRPNFWGRK